MSEKDEQNARYNALKILHFFNASHPHKKRDADAFEMV